MKIPEFRRFWIGALISNSGSWMQNVSVPFVLYELTESATWVGLASFMQFIPALIFGPLGGSIADRYPRRTVLMVAQSVMAVLSLGLWALWASGTAQAWSVTVMVALLGAVAGLMIGSWQAFVPELVPRPLLLNAVTLNSAQFNGARAFGPAVGGLVLATLGPSGAFAINAFSFVAVIFALSTIRARPAAIEPDPDGGRPSVFRETKEAASYIRTMPGIWACIVVILSIGFLGSPVFPMLVVFAREVFHVDGSLYGLLGAALGIGGVLATPLVAGRGSGMRRSSLARISMAAYAVSLVAFAFSPVYAMGVVALIAAGGAYLAIASTLNTTIQMQVDEKRRGKVLSLYVMGLTSSYPLGALAQGALADYVSVRVVTAVAGLLLLAVWAWLRYHHRFAAMDDEIDPDYQLSS